MTSGCKEIANVRCSKGLELGNKIRVVDIGQTVKFNSVGASVILVSLGTYAIMGMVWTDRIAGQEGKAIGEMQIGHIGIIAITVLFLFLVTSHFLDRKL